MRYGKENFTLDKDTQALLSELNVFRLKSNEGGNNEERYKELLRRAQDLWEQRGYWSLQSFMENSYWNWEFLAEILQIKGNVQDLVERAARDYLQGKSKPKGVPPLRDFLKYRIGTTNVLSNLNLETKIKINQKPLLDDLESAIKKNIDLFHPLKQVTLAVLGRLSTVWPISMFYETNSPIKYSQAYLLRLRLLHNDRVALIDYVERAFLKRLGKKAKVTREKFINAIKEAGLLGFELAGNDSAWDSKDSQSLSDIDTLTTQRLNVGRYLALPTLLEKYVKDLDLRKELAKDLILKKLDLIHLDAFAENYLYLRKLGLIRNFIDLGPEQSLTPLRGSSVLAWRGDEINSIYQKEIQALDNTDFENLYYFLLRGENTNVLSGFNQDSIQVLLEYFLQHEKSGVSTAETVQLRFRIYEFLVQKETKSEITDRFLLDGILMALPMESSFVYYDKAINRGSIFNKRILREYGEEYLAQREMTIKKLNRAPSQRELYYLVKAVDSLFEGKEKDDKLESIATIFKLRRETLQSLIQDHKSDNLGRANPILLNLASTVSPIFSQMRKDEKLELLRTIVDPHAHPMSDTLAKRMRIIGGGRKDLKKNKNYYYRKDTNGTEQAYQEVIERFMSYLKVATQNEKIPLIENLITAGLQNPDTVNTWYLSLMEQILDYKPGSTPFKQVIAYFRSIDVEKIAPTLAYLIAQSGKDKSTLVEAFTLFGTPGKKFGQLSAILKLFDEQTCKDLEQLKDNTDPQTLAEIEAMLEKTYPELADNIEFVEILGSASIKTVVLIRFKDSGEYAVAMVLRENAKELSHYHLQSGIKYLNELEKEGFGNYTGLFKSMVSYLKEQLTLETNLVEEFKKVTLASQHIEKLNQDLKAVRGDIRFVVPTQYKNYEPKESMAIFQLGHGKKWAELTKAEQERFGPLTAKVNLRLFLEYGFWEPDRHTGNFLFDTTRNEIALIDWGQMTNFEAKGRFQTDDVTLFANFILAVKVQDWAHLLELVWEMRDTENSISDRAAYNAVVEELKSVMDNNVAFYDKLLGLLNKLGEYGIVLKGKFSFSALKGLAVLMKENYVSENDFQSIFATEIERYYKFKWPALALKGDFRTLMKLAKERVKGRNTPELMSVPNCQKALED